MLPALLGLMVLLWSFNFIVGKVVLRELPPLLASGLRIVGAGALMLPIYALSGRRSLPLARSDLAPLVVLGVTGIALNQVFFLVGLERTTVAHAALIFGLSPILVLGAAAGAGQESLTTRKLVGMLVALGGVAVLHLGPGAASGATLSGDLLVLAGASAFALFTVLSKPFTGRYGAIAMNTIGYVGGAMALAPLIAWEARHFPFRQVSAPAWAALAYLVVAGSWIGFTAYLWLLEHSTPARATSYAYVNPAVAVLLGWALRGEPLTGRVLLALLLVAGAVALVLRDAVRPVPAAPPARRRRPRSRCPAP